MNEVINFDYQNLDSKKWMMLHCKLSDVNLKSFHHSKTKNYVTNNIYCSSDELSETERLIFLFIYDLKAQQKYLPWIHINQDKIAFILWKSKAVISRSINNLISYNIIIKEKDRFWEYMYIPNENIDKWWVSIDIDRLNFLEEKRKHTASSNTQLTEEYKYSSKMK